MFDFAVVVPTLLRPSLARACQSVIEQGVDGSVNLLVGVDLALGDRAILDQVRTLARPPKRRITIVDPGYSTSALRGGVFPCRAGGGLRSALSFLGNARHLAFLDDDNWFAPNHLESLGQAIRNKPWAFSLRTFIDSRTGAALGIDQWESVGPGRGIYAKRFGGFCDTSTYLLDTLAAEAALPHWSYGVSLDGCGEDRRIFQQLRPMPHGASGLATVNYTLRHLDPNHRLRLRWLEGMGAKPSRPTAFAEAAARLRAEGARAGPPARPLSTEAIAALRATLNEAKATNVLVIGSLDPALAPLIETAAAERGTTADILCLDPSKADPLAPLRALRAEEVLADLGYVGALPLDRLAATLDSLWGLVRRTGAVLALAAQESETAAQLTVLERFAYERAVPLTRLGPPGAMHYVFPRY